MKPTRRAGANDSVSRIGEFGLIERILDKFPVRNASSILIGPGDDAAVINCRNGAAVVLTTDMLVEGTHFRLEWSCPEAVGFKAVTANLSDIAAMGAVPVGIVVSLGVPASVPTRAVDLLYRGMSEAMSSFGGELLGGDTVRSDRVTISIAAVGRLAGERPLLRSSARKGDLVCVTGSLGRPEMGLLLLKKYVERQGGSRVSAMLAWAGRRVGDFRAKIPARIRRDGYSCVLTHLMPAPRMREAQLLARRRNCAPSSMIDVSDGLSSDLNQLALASKVDILIYEGRIPVHPSAVSTANYLRESATRAAISSGEEYELLLTVPPARLDGLLRSMKTARAGPLSVIGEVTVPRGRSGRGSVTLVGLDGVRNTLIHRGFKHF